MLELSAKFIAAGLSTISISGSGIGIGIIFGSLILGISLIQTLFAKCLCSQF